jgi:parallel beta-helix repeat protein
MLVALIALLGGRTSPAYAANFTVNAGGDGGDANLADPLCKNANGNCTFRAAIEQANANAGTPDIITFNLGTATLNPATPYPALTDDGTTIQGNGQVTLDGSNAPGATNGLVINGSSHNKIQGLIIRDFAAGIEIIGTELDPATNNFIGTDGDGNNDGALERNVIRNNGYGILIFGEGVEFNVVAGNYIGTNESGLNAQPNAHSGISINYGDYNRIGTDGNGVSDSAERNVISGNVTNGVALSFAHSTIIAGNYIGVNANGSAALGSNRGVGLFSASGLNVIGTNGDGSGDSAERNVISGNYVGIDIGGNNTNRIAGNYIGTNAAGTAALGNTYAGISITDAVVGGLIGTDGDGVSDSAERNVISGNGQYGIRLMNANYHSIAGNYIGTNAAGSAALPNGEVGLALFSGYENTIGTDGDGTADAAERNVISGNTAGGLSLAGEAYSNVVAGNYIGTNAAGDAALGNVYYGISLFGEDVHGNIIGGCFCGSMNAAMRNVISGNGQGIWIYQADGNQIAGNYIGTNAAGNAALGNARAGISLEGGADWNLIGTDSNGVTDSAERNIISGNGAAPGPVYSGIDLAASNSNVIAGNYIGTNAAGTAALGNGKDGIGIYGNDNRIGTNGNGTADSAERNVISGNSQHGIAISTNVAAFSHGNVVAGNYIGTNAAGTGPLGNGYDGVIVYGGGHENMIGGDLPIEGNIIAFNGYHGVEVGAAFDVVPDATNIAILSNSIYSNTVGVGIRLGVGGTNDPGDGDSGANGQLNTPDVLLATTTGAEISISAEIAQGLPDALFIVQFFSSPTCDPLGYGEGKTYLGQTTGVTDGSGNLAINTNFVKSVPAGSSITATATLIGPGFQASTSEFSACAPAVLMAALQSPGNGSVVKTLLPKFKWSRPRFAEQYRIQIATDPDFREPVLDEVTKKNQFKPSRNQALQAGVTYYWRVQTRDATGNWGPFSEVFSFTTSR